MLPDFSGATHLLADLGVAPSFWGARRRANQRQPTIRRSSVEASAALRHPVGRSIESIERSIHLRAVEGLEERRGLLRAAHAAPAIDQEVRHAADARVLLDLALHGVLPLL